MKYSVPYSMDGGGSSGSRVGPDGSRSFFLVADQRRPMTSGKDDSAEFDAEMHRSIEQVRRA